jgi:ABC-type transporter Mla MlaB component
MAETPFLVVVRIEGSLVADLLDLLEAESRAVLTADKWLGLDLYGVTKIDSNGITMLKRLSKERVQLINCPLTIRVALKD